MALQKQSMKVPLAAGLSQRIDDKVDDTPIKIENGVFDKIGAVNKRNGFRHLSRSIADSVNKLEKATGLAAYRDELLCFASNRLYGLTEGAGDWVNKGPLIPVNVRTTEILGDLVDYSDYQQLSFAIAKGVGLAAITAKRIGDATAGRFVYFVVFDLVTGQPIQVVQQTLAGASSNYCACVAVGEELLGIYQSGGNAISAKVFDTNDPGATPGTQALAADFDATVFEGFDATEYTDDYGLLVYPTAGDDWKLLEINGSGTNRSVTHNPADGLECALAVFVGTDLAGGEPNIWVAWGHFSTGNEVYVSAVDSNAFTLIATDTKTVETGLSGVPVSITMHNWYNAGVQGVRLFYELDSTAAYDRLIRTATVDEDDASATAAAFSRSVGLASKAWSYEDTIYVGTVHQSDDTSLDALQNTYFVLNESAEVVARITPARAGAVATEDSRDTQARLCSVHELEPGVFSFLGVRRGIEAQGGAVFTTQSDEVTFSLVAHKLDYPAAHVKSVELGENLHLGDGILRAYDGLQCVEHGFNLYPKITAATPNVANGLLSDGSYIVQAVYEWVDAKGQVHRSAPSPAQAVSVGLGGVVQSIVLAVSTLRLTDKSNVRVVGYISQASGTVLYPDGYIPNDPTADTVNVTVGKTSQTDLITRAAIYTTGGVLDNIPPPSPRDLIAHDNRLAVISDDNEITYSKSWTEDNGVAFSDAFRIVLDPKGGLLTALASQDGNMIGIRENAVFAITGQGPNDTGGFGGFSEPRFLSSEVGASAGSAVLLTKLGTIFKSDKGIYLLDRSLSLGYFGANVDDFSGYALVDVAVSGIQHRYGLLVNDGDTMLSYDDYSNHWSTFAGINAVGLTVWKDLWAWIDRSGQPRVESPGEYMDGLDPYSMVIETAWIKTAGIQGFQRIWWLYFIGEFNSRHTFKVTTYVDYSETPVQTVEVSGSDLAPDGVNTVMQLRVKPKIQKCESLKVRIEDTNQEPPYESYKITDLMIVAGVKRGLYRPKPQQTA